jgi:type IV secretory pathway VirB10-like protein
MLKRNHPRQTKVGRLTHYVSVRVREKNGGVKMKLVLGTAVMILVVGAPSYARQEPDKDKPQQQEPKKQEEPKKGEEPNKGRQEQPADKSRQEPARQQPEDRAKPAQQNDRTQQQQQDERNRNQAAKPAQQQQQEERNRNEQSRPAQQQDRPQDQQRAQQTQQHNDRATANDRGNAGNANERGGTRRVPDEQFRASFGSSHHFRVQRGERRFNYGGYYFSYSEAWPSDWDYDDDVYIDYIDGNYYLINPRHPGIRLLVVIVD